MTAAGSAAALLPLNPQRLTNLARQANNGDDAADHAGVLLVSLARDLGPDPFTEAALRWHDIRDAVHELDAFHDDPHPNEVIQGWWSVGYDAAEAYLLGRLDDAIHHTLGSTS